MRWPWLLLIGGPGLRQCGACLMRLPWRSRRPWICMRQLESFETMKSACGLGGGSALDLAHGGGDGGELGGEGAAEAAAGLRVAHLDEFEPLDVREEACAAAASPSAPAGRGIRRGKWPLPGNRAPTSVTPSFVTRKSENSQVRSPTATASAPRAVLAKRSR